MPGGSQSPVSPAGSEPRFCSQNMHGGSQSPVSPAGSNEITSPDFRRHEEHTYIYKQIQAKDPNVYNKQNLKPLSKHTVFIFKMTVKENNRSNQYLFEDFLKK